ncbi:MAG: uracil-DNA glycosylase [Patescibacteria group bacterium]|nr:uracil-DNA glycosylase [Patescibacteria group bacterium]
MDTETGLRKIKQEVLNCKKCSLYKERLKDGCFPVIGEGSHISPIMFIGEAPGFQEAKTGRPFCGASGKILDELLESIGINRKEVYICNLLKCRPPNNRNPKPEEIKVCVPYLERQIDIIKPKVICLLGNYSTAYIFQKYGLKEEFQGISKIHGKIFEVKILIDLIKIIPLYHPAVAVYNKNMIEVLKKDFQILKNC